MTRGAMPDLALDDLEDAKVISVDGTRLGSVADVFYDEATGVPEWVLVSTGLLGTSYSIVPVVGAELDRGDLVIPFTKEQVTTAPDVDEHGELTTDEEAEIARHYGMAYSEAESGTGTPTGAPGSGEVEGAPAADVSMAGEPTSVDVSQVDRRDIGRPSALRRLRNLVTSEDEERPGR